MNKTEMPAGNRVVKPAICRVCLGFCGLNVTLSEGRVVKVVGDRRNPITGGYTCEKGRAIPEQLAHPERLLGALKRMPQGFAPLESSQAIAEVAHKLREIVERHGPRAVAVYIGTGSAGYPAAVSTAQALWREIGSPMVFSPSSIDQPGKQVASALHGYWQGGVWNPSNADVWTFIGTNPLATMYGGTVMYNPVQQLRTSRKRGMKVIVVDPRRGELARHADLHLPIRPGQDPVLLAAIIRLLLDSGRYDSAFVSEHAVGLEVLRAAVEPFTLEQAATRTGLSIDDIRRAADLLASSRRGGISAGTGPNMSPRGVLFEYLLLCLQTLCGYWGRRGDPVPNPGVHSPPRAWREQAQASRPAFGFGERLRIAGLRQSAAGMPTAVLPDEILLDGPGRVRALVNLGGNPVTAFPNERKAIAAMEALELLVTCDLRMSGTASLSHYVFGTRFHLEVPEITLNEGIREYGAGCDGFPLPYGMYAPALSADPDGSDLIEEWQLLRGIAQTLGKPLEVNGIALATRDECSTDDVLDAVTAKATIRLAELRRHERGHLFPIGTNVGPPEPGVDRKLRLGEAAGLARLAECLRDAHEPGDELLLVCRRMRSMKNSWGMDIASLARPHPHGNPAWLNPADMRALGIQEDAAVEIASEFGSIRCTAKADKGLREGTVSISHGWGPQNGSAGGNTNALTDNLHGADAITGMPVMSALPVTVRAVA